MVSQLVVVSDEEMCNMTKNIVSNIMHGQISSNHEWQKVVSDFTYKCHFFEEDKENLKSLLIQEICCQINSIFKKILSTDGDSELLRIYLKEWTLFKVNHRVIYSTFYALNEPFTKTKDESFSEKVFLEIWHNSVISVFDQLERSILKVLIAERNGEELDHSLVPFAWTSLLDLCKETGNTTQSDIYQRKFEDLYVNSTKEYYREKLSEFLKTNSDVLSYVDFVEAEMVEEKQWVRPGVNETLIEKMVVASLEELIIPHEKKFLDACLHLLKTNCNNTVKKVNLFSFLHSMPDGEEKVAHVVEEFIKSNCITAALAEVADQITMNPLLYMVKLLDQFQQRHQFMKDTFDDNVLFVPSLSKAYQHVVNDASVFEKSFGELFAYLVDQLLRKTDLSRNLSTEELDAKLQELALLLSQVCDKEPFVAWYKKCLLQRVLSKNCWDVEQEKKMIDYLKLWSGISSGYILLLLTAFLEMAGVEEVNRKLKQKTDSVEFNMIDYGVWTERTECNHICIPSELNEPVKKMKKIVKDTLGIITDFCWQANASTVHVDFTNEMGTYELEVTMFQATLLNRWKESMTEKVSFLNLLLSTGIPEAQLRKELYNLVAFPEMKHQILLTDASLPLGSAKDFGKDTLFWMNIHFHTSLNGEVEKEGKASVVGQLTYEPFEQI